MDTLEKYIDFLNTEKNTKNRSGWEIKRSPIHGYGTFATKKYNKDDFIEVALIERENTVYINDYHRTEFGAYVNHSKNSNSILKENGRLVELYATKEINPGDEIVCNYNTGLALKISGGF